MKSYHNAIMQQPTLRISQHAFIRSILLKNIFKTVKIKASRQLQTHKTGTKSFFKVEYVGGTAHDQTRS